MISQRITNDLYKLTNEFMNADPIFQIIDLIGLGAFIIFLIIALVKIYGNRY